MRGAYRITRSAQRDLQEISNYWVDRAGQEAALAVLNSIMETIVTLSSHPRAGLAVWEFGHGVRKFYCRNYIIYYRVRSLAMEILHVFHGARNQRRAWGRRG